MITSTSNSQIKNVIKLQKSASKRKKEKCFIVEGIRMFREVPKKDLIQVFVTEQFYEKEQILFQDISYELISENVFKQISDTMTPQGVLAVVKQKEYQLESILSKEAPAIVLLENLQDPGNLGTILRVAEGANITGIILSKDTVDIYNSKVVRATMGAIFRVPFVYVEDLQEVMQILKRKGIKTYAAHLQGNSFYQKDYTKGTCFLIGNEGNGLSDELSNLAEEKIRIPMYGEVESLNAATATTVLVYEMLRQRIDE